MRSKIAPNGLLSARAHGVRSGRKVFWLLLLLVSVPSLADQQPERNWWRGKVFYEIFVRSFADSNGDGVGDLRGVIEKLPYLNDGQPGKGDDLEVDALWLMPIHPSPSYHGYDVTNYKDVNPDYGTLADMDALIKAAHQRGVRIIIDLVLNHTSTQHPWFVSAAKGEKAPYRDYYLWSQPPPEWKRSWDGVPVWHSSKTEGNQDWWYYGLFWSGMPDLNFNNPKVETEMLAVMRFWLARGVDGFRVDAARHLFEGPKGQLEDQPATHELVKRLRAVLQKDHPNLLLVAEAWTNTDNVAAYYGKGDEFHLTFGFEMAGSIKEAVRDRTVVALHHALTRAEKVYPDRGFEAPFLANHDMARVMKDLAGDGRANRLAAAILFALPGTPFLYYGEEIGMQGGPDPRDEDKRTPMRWTPVSPAFGFSSQPKTWYGKSEEATGVDVQSQQKDPASLWHLIQRLIALRHLHPALSTGQTTRPPIEGVGRGLFALLRSTPTQRVLLVVNLNNQPCQKLVVKVPGTPRVLLAEGLAGQPTSENGQLVLPGLEARSFVFLETTEAP